MAETVFHGTRAVNTLPTFKSSLFTRHIEEDDSPIKQCPQLEPIKLDKKAPLPKGEEPDTIGDVASPSIAPSATATAGASAAATSLGEANEGTRGSVGSNRCGATARGLPSLGARWGLVGVAWRGSESAAADTVVTHVRGCKGDGNVLGTQ